MQRLGFFATLTLALLAGWLVHSAKLVPADTGLGSISVPAGFQVELAVKPGLVNYSMLVTLDDQGRLFLCESSGKTVKTPEMSSDPTYVVSMLEDTDGDGVFDKSTVFADKLTLPAGAVWYQGSLYVAAPPRLYKFTDTNGDGVADLRETIVEGWNLSANAASLHGPIMGCTLPTDVMASTSTPKMASILKARRRAFGVFIPMARGWKCWLVVASIIPLKWLLLKQATCLGP